MKQASQWLASKRLLWPLGTRSNQRRLAMLTVGLDVHFRKSSLCVLDARGKVLGEEQVLGGWERVVERLGTLSQPFKICYEASIGYGHLYERIGSLPLARQIEV